MRRRSQVGIGPSREMLPTRKRSPPKGAVTLGCGQYVYTVVVSTRMASKKVAERHQGFRMSKLAAKRARHSPPKVRVLRQTLSSLA